MPAHDWTRVSAGTFHHFHHLWITEISNALNGGLLPANYFAMAEQIAGQAVPDVLTLENADASDREAELRVDGTTAVALAPPRVRFKTTKEIDRYAMNQRTLVIRRSGPDRIVALIELVSPGNKASQHGLRSFVVKAAAALRRDYHLLLIDLNPPGPRDPEGIHGALWSELGGVPYTIPPGEPLTLAAYAAGQPVTAYVEPFAVGDPLIDMPLFLDPEHYVPVPLEATYQAAWRGVPRRWREVLENPVS